MGEKFPGGVGGKMSSSLSGGEFPGIGVARDAVGAPAPPRAVKKIFRPNLQGKCVSAPPGHEVHPQPEQESIFRTVFATWLRF